MMAHDISEVAIILIRGIATLSLVTLAYGFVARNVAAVVTKGIAIGLAFGLAAVYTMSDPFVLEPGVIVDARSIILILAAPFGGTTAALVAGAIAALYRGWLGGVGAELGIIVIGGATAIGLVCSILLTKRDDGYDIRSLIVLATAGSSQSLLLFLIPLFAPNADPTPIIALHFAASWIGLLLLGSFLTAEGRRRHFLQSIERDAATDPLTGLSNRRAFDRAVDRAVGPSGRLSKQTSLLLIDIDNFKAFNDRWGHASGDAVLKNVAHIIRRHVRDDDIVARYGGEEIAIILSAADERCAIDVATTIRRAVEESVFRLNQKAETVTVSIGVAASDPSSTFEDMFLAADKALYRAKELGRNRVESKRLRGIALSAANDPGPDPFAPTSSTAS